jgi:thioester reductase-like protein
MPTILFTGFPGFLGSELLPRALARRPEARALCVVQPKFLDLARGRVAELNAADPSLTGRIALARGDITVPGFGLALDAIAADIVEIHHLAAVYDLAVRRDLAMKVNVEGTRNVIAAARMAGSLERLHYVSTCYVSGRYAGVFRESDLEMGQTFNNYYEETKYLAEVEVQRAMREGLPATIYRPAIVVGDSSTGATQKFDGPYFVIQWLMRQPRVAVMPVIGRPKKYVLNVVPRDFAVRAIDHLSSLGESRGKVYHLADPAPLDIDSLLVELGRASGRRMMRIPLPRGFAKWAIDYLPGVHALMKIPSESIDYFVHPARYDTSEADRDLAGSGIEVPRFAGYLPNLIRFWSAHREIGAAAMA